ncbi:MAG: hypothetical protein EBZ77_04365, partial [Chitinophagia bacterium]|nr:hypothetical protein [Chitinophagia bacterium]
MNLELDNDTQLGDAVTGTSQNDTNSENSTATNERNETVTAQAGGDENTTATETIDAAPEAEEVQTVPVTEQEHTAPVAEITTEQVAAPEATDRNAKALESLMAWWDQQTFPGKASYRIDANGNLMLNSQQFLKERKVAHLSPENADFVLHNLREKYNDLLARVTEVETEWLAAEDKLKVADRVDHIKELLQAMNVVGEIEKPAAIVGQWMHTIGGLIAENIQRPQTGGMPGKGGVPGAAELDQVDALVERYRMMTPKARMVAYLASSQVNASKRSTLETVAGAGTVILG